MSIFPKPQSSPLPGEHRRLTHRYCWQCLAPYATLAAFLAVSLWFNHRQDWLQKLTPLSGGLQCLLPVYYWSSMIRRLRRGEIAELIYPTEFRRRTSSEIVWSRIGIVGLALLISVFSIWLMRTSNRHEFSLECLLLAFNAATCWGVHYVFTRSHIVMKAPEIKFTTVAADTTA